ncbi:unnamed protein product, partial [Staurois parvus]
MALGRKGLTASRLPNSRNTATGWHGSPPCQLGHTALDGCAQNSYPKQCAYSEA